MDFFLWRFLKEQVHQTEPTSVYDLRCRMTDACTSVRPEMLLNVQREALS